MKRALLAAGLVLATAALTAALALPDRFPHREHSAVFPVCTGCHAGIPTNDSAAFYPSPSDCAQCHDGVTEDRIDWPGPAPRASNLDYRHDEHATAVVAAGDSAACATCHQEAGASERMAVGPPRPDLCVTCHAHEAAEHLAADAECRTCHVPLVAAQALTPARIEALPRPATHDAPDFLLDHRVDASGVNGTCSVCHAQESCTRCHLNGLSVAAIAALPADTRVRALVADRAPEYPEPFDHQAGGWGWVHAEAAQADPVRCASCHAQASCRSCHQGDGHPAIAGQPVASVNDPRGVRLDGDVAVHPAGFGDRHGVSAATGDARCSNCHAQQETCFACHTSAGQPAFHRPNYRERHAADAYAGDRDCTSCHSAEGFCRACHAGVGLASRGRTDAGFHTAQPFWLLAHGQAARQGLQACASCHAQRDCARCHSALGAWRINPHGTGFPAERVQSRNRLACLTCHGTEPGGTP